VETHWCDQLQMQRYNGMRSTIVNIIKMQAKLVRRAPAHQSIRPSHFVSGKISHKLSARSSLRCLSKAHNTNSRLQSGNITANALELVSTCK
jgi:hypothetical protein